MYLHAMHWLFIQGCAIELRKSDHSEFALSNFQGSERSDACLTLP